MKPNVTLLLLAALLLSGCITPSTPRIEPNIKRELVPLTLRAIIDTSLEWQEQKAGRFLMVGSGTHSMEPYFFKGDVLLCEPVTSETVFVPGMMVAVWDSVHGVTMLHMVTSVRGNRLYIQGTYSLAYRGWYDRSAVLGVIVRVEAATR